MRLRIFYLEERIVLNADLPTGSVDNGFVPSKDGMGFANPGLYANPNLNPYAEGLLKNPEDMTSAFPYQFPILYSELADNGYGTTYSVDSSGHLDTKIEYSDSHSVLLLSSYTVLKDPSQAIFFQNKDDKGWYALETPELAAMPILTSTEVNAWYKASDLSYEESSDNSYSPVSIFNNEQFITNTNNAMSDGHCFGIATFVMELYLQKQGVDVSTEETALSQNTIQDINKYCENCNNAFDLSLYEDWTESDKLNDPLANKLISNFALQTLSHTENYRFLFGLEEDPLETVKALYNNLGTLQTENQFVLTLHHASKDANGHLVQEGHAITPYKVSEDGSGGYKIFVYDNNHPGDDERSISVKSGEDGIWTWTYTMQTGEVWESNLEFDTDSAKYNRLEIIPLNLILSDASSDLSQATHDFIPDSTSGTYIAFSGAHEASVTLSTGASLNLYDHPFDEITGASFRTIYGGGGGELSYGLYLPEAMEFTLALSGGSEGATLSKFGYGGSVAVNDLEIDSGKEHLFSFDSQGYMTYLAGNASDHLSFNFGYENNDQTMNFLFDAVAVNENTGLSFAFDDSEGSIRMGASQGLANTYDFSATRSANGELDTFNYSNMSLADNGANHYLFDDWSKSGSLVWGHDATNDGILDFQGALINGY